MTVFEHPWGTLVLHRWPRRRRETLQAWDNADRYLLDTLKARAKGATSLVVNDQQGALALGAMHHGPVQRSGDSFVADLACRKNREVNQLDGLPEPLWPFDTLPAPPDQVLMRVPKSLALLEWQLQWLSEQLPVGAPVWLAGMDKHLPRQLVPMMQQYLGNGRAELGWKKARLFSAEAPGERLAVAPYPTEVEGPMGPLTVHAGVFAQQQLDIGARFFLAHLPDSLPAGARVADLGCGNGVIGLALLQACPDSQLVFCDESWLALQSARDNVARYCPESASEFHLGDGLVGCDERFDLILLNPPFHDGYVVGDHVARRLFRQSKQALNAGGELRVIGNRHLSYHKLLGKLFGKVEVLGSNQKFVVWRCS
ncbi:MAG: class I SAM-dependent methyltransferase [Pseudomonadales bacterium]|nr:class I SAM-dependent methyltransferase [Pseudomonadales bacterium]